MDPIVLTDVRKAYGSTKALDAVSLTIEPGTVHALVGPNGSGKTTLLRILFGVTTPDAGQVSIPNVDIGCGFQTPQLYPQLTVGENLSLFAELEAGQESWVERLAEQCGLNRVRHREVHALSAGVAKRLDIAIALLGRPDVVLFDEPLADIDAEYQDRILSLLAEYASDARTLVLATHRLTTIEPLLDVVSIIEDGSLVTSTKTEGIAPDLQTYYRDRLTGF